MCQVKLAKLILARPDIGAVAKLAWSILRESDGAVGTRDIGKIIGCSHVTVWRALDELLGAGWIRKEQEGKQAHRFIAIDPPPATAAPIEPEPDPKELFADDPTPQKKQPAKKEKERAPRARDPVWDAVVEVFGLTQIMESQRGIIGKVVAELKQLGATAEEIKVRHGRITRSWGPDKRMHISKFPYWFTQFATDPAAENGQRPAGSAAGGRCQQRARSRGEYPEPKRDIPHL